MAQWQELLKLDSATQSEVCRLYEGKFPREIRHCLSDCIESQNWEVAVSDERTARTALQALVARLSALRNESIHQHNGLMGPDYSAMRDFILNRFETCPVALAKILCECLREEKHILIYRLKDQEQKQKDLNDKVEELIRQTWESEGEIKSLEAQNERLSYMQSAFTDQDKKVNGLSHDFVQQQCLKQFNTITHKKQVVLDQVVKSVHLAAQIVETLVSVELPKWKRRQQMQCIGKPVDASLGQLEKWFSAVGETLMQIVQQLKKLQDQSRAQTNDTSNVTEAVQQIHSFTTALLTKLLTNALVVEKQPTMSKLSHRPCILKTSAGFTVTLRFLVNLPVLKFLLKVQPVFDKDIEEVNTVKGFRQIVFLKKDSKCLGVYTPKGGLIAEFGHLSIKEGTKSRVTGANENLLLVTEELHVISFVTTLQLPGLQCHIEAKSLPVVVISNTVQVPSAWASIMWYNLLEPSPATQSLSMFLDPPPLSWKLLSQALSWQFLTAGDRELNQDQLQELKLKIVDDPDDRVYWHTFAKNEGPWIWIDGILDLIQKYLKDIWRDGCVMGFVNKERTRQLLQSKQSGNFLLRFSESNRKGAITFSWVEHSNGEVNVHAVEPYTKKELEAMSLPDIIYHYSLRAQQRTSINPLVYLYPDRPKDSAFGAYYTTHEVPAPVNKDGYVNRTLISVSDCPSPPPSPPGDTHMESDPDVPQASLSAADEELLPDWLSSVLDTTLLSPLPLMEQLMNYEMCNNFDV